MIQDFAQRGPSSDQLAGARSALDRELETGFQENADLLNELTTKVEYGEDIADVFNLRPFYDQLTTTALRDAAREYLNAQPLRAGDPSSRREVEAMRKREPLRSILRLVAVGLLTAHVLAAPQASPSAQPWRDPSPHQVRWITVDSSVRLEVLDWGGSGPPAVLLGCYLTAHGERRVRSEADESVPCIRHYATRDWCVRQTDTGYAVQRSANDVLEVLDSLNLQRSLLIGTSCAGQILTLFARNIPIG